MPTPGTKYRFGGNIKGLLRKITKKLGYPNDTATLVALIETKAAELHLELEPDEFQPTPIQLFVSGDNGNCKGLPFTTFTLLGPTYTASSVLINYADCGWSKLVGWIDLNGGSPASINIAKAIGPNHPEPGYLAWGGSAGIRIYDDLALPDETSDLPPGYGFPYMWVAKDDLPPEVLEVVG